MVTSSDGYVMHVHEKKQAVAEFRDETPMTTRLYRRLLGGAKIKSMRGRIFLPEVQREDA
jgi:hypothetical protein